VKFATLPSPILWIRGCSDAGPLMYTGGGVEVLTQVLQLCLGDLSSVKGPYVVTDMAAACCLHVTIVRSS
jgi:hypothetical protein